MGIRQIDQNCCTGCGICVEVCPLDVLRLDEKDEKRVLIQYLRDCQSCHLCAEECPEDAITVSYHRERRIPMPW